MRRRRQPSQSRTVRNRQNQVSGLLLGFGLIVGVLALDPFCLVQSCFYLEMRYRVIIVLETMSISMSALVFFWRPRVLLEQSRLVILNPLRDITIPRGRIERIDEDAGRYVRIVVDGERITAWGMEQAPVVTAFGGAPSLPEGTATGSPAAGVVVRRWRRPERLEVLALASWVGYLSLGLLFGKY